jgi:hypothetical protein
MDNQIKRICSEVVYSEKVQRISDMKWAGSKHRATTGTCQFCNNPLPFAYRVFTPDGACHEVELNSKGGKKAQNLIDTKSIPEGTHIYALASCEAMCEPQVYVDGINHYGKRADDWSEKVKSDAAKRVKDATASPVTTLAGSEW